jgi:hypothetical protein
MVRTLFSLLAALWMALAPGLNAAEALSPSAKALEALPPLPARPAIPDRKPNVAWEDMSAVTLVSLPFTAFWALLGALAIGGFQQGRFPPEMDTPLLTGAAAVAAGASLSIGLVSVSWGGPSKPAKADD